MSASKRQKTEASSAAAAADDEVSTLNASTGKEQNFTHLLPPHWEEEVQGWVRDDVPSIDIGG